jgi:hypothetical protein
LTTFSNGIAAGHYTENEASHFETVVETSVCEILVPGSKTTLFDRKLKKFSVFKNLLLSAAILRIY